MHVDRDLASLKNDEYMNEKSQSMVLIISETTRATRPRRTTFSERVQPINGDFEQQSYGALKPCVVEISGSATELWHTVMRVELLPV